MANLCIAALNSLRESLVGEGGVNGRLDEIAARDMVEPLTVEEERVVIRHAPPKLADEASVGRYPTIYLYCDRIENRLERKFSQFAGRVFLAVDVRVSGDSMEQLDGEIFRLTEAVTDTLASRHGRWTENLAFDGKYEVKFEAVRLGGRDFLQTSRVEIELLGHA